MPADRALLLALDLLSRPGLARAMRERPLPEDVGLLIRIVAGDEAALTEAHRLTGQPAERLGRAAALYIQQILFTPGTDPHRVLGGTARTPQVELRRHMRLLMKWLHPDTARNDWESVYAERVLSAWRDLKSAPSPVHPGRASAHRRRYVRPPAFRVPWITRPAAPRKEPRIARVISFVLLVAGLLGGLLAIPGVRQIVSERLEDAEPAAVAGVRPAEPAGPPGSPASEGEPWKVDDGTQPTVIGNSTP